MSDDELSVLVRENYSKANAEYLVEQIRAAVTPHAHWIETPTAWKCSNCGTEYWSMNHEFKYCPECGAKIDYIEGTEE